MANEIQCQDTSGGTVYCVLSAWGGPNSGQVWAGSELAALTYSGWSSAAIAMSSIGSGAFCGTSTYAANFPAVDSAGYWLGVAHRQAGNAPAPNDPLTTDSGTNQLVFQTNASGEIVPLFGGASQLFAPSIFSLPADLYNEFGQNNIVQWSQLNGTKNEDTGRELFMCLRAATIIRSFFTGGTANILSSNPDMPSVNMWSSVIAGCLLFAARGAEVGANTGGGGLFSRTGSRLPAVSFGRYEGKYDFVQQEMGEFRAGTRTPQGQYKPGAYYGSSDPPIFPNGIIVGGPWGL